MNPTMDIRTIQLIASFDRPTKHGKLRVRAYMKNGGIAFAISRGEFPKEDALVRVQSPCLFGESFGVNSCDCAAQLDEALRRGSQESSFLLVYCLDQEGRGLGMLQKIQAVAFEVNNGVTMAEAFDQLKLPVDIRDYTFASEIVKEINGDLPIRLLTNYPKKIAALTELGITITKREPLLIPPPNPECRRYLTTKKEAFGHLIPDELLATSDAVGR